MKRFICIVMVLVCCFSAAGQSVTDEDNLSRNGAGEGKSAARKDVSEDALTIRFLGTGAADWKGRDSHGELRRLTSILVDGHILIDYTTSDADMLDAECSVRDIVYTHSHGDHYNASAALRLRCKRVYLSSSWVERAQSDFAREAEKLNSTGQGSERYTVPEIIPLEPGIRFEIDGIRITALPANHATSHMDEQALMYLLEKGSARVLYATDTGGIPALAARLCGIDPHATGTPITGLIMEATMSDDEDFRIFTHSSIGTVLHTANMLLKTGRYSPAPGTPVYLTHLARTLHGTQADLDANLPSPLKAAYDGLEVQF